MKPLELRAQGSFRTGAYSGGRTYPNAEVAECRWKRLPDTSFDRLVPSFVSGGKSIYAYGRVSAKFSSLSLEKEFYQALEGLSTRQSSDQFDVENTVDVDILNQELNRTDLLYSVLSKPENIYIAREMIWIFQDLAGVIEYVIASGTDDNVSLLVNAIAPGRDGLAATIILIGELIFPASVPALINASTVRLVALRKALTATGTGGDDGTFQQIQSLLINQGATNGDRALNFVLLNHGDFYSTTQALLQPIRGTPTAYGFTVVSAQTVVKQINQDEIADVIFTYAPETSGPRIQYYASVDITSLFPFVVVPFTKYLTRL